MCMVMSHCLLEDSNVVEVDATVGYKAAIFTCPNAKHKHSTGGARHCGAVPDG